MSVTNGMFVFEVVVTKVTSMVESRVLVIRTDFADIFSLELKDPKQMHIVIPEPPPLPPEPVGKKGKKKKAKPKKKKGNKKKGKNKKGIVEEPPPEPVIQSGQSVLFSSTAEFLIQNMKKFPLEMSLWSKEDNLNFIGSVVIPWDPIFRIYLDNIISNSQEPGPITLTEEYNIFEEGTAKRMAKVGIQIKLTHLGEKVTTAFRTLSEDPTVRKCLYTGINSKTTSYICTMKTTDEVFEENSNKIDSNFVVDKPKEIVYATYTNAPGANLTFFDDANGEYCCLGHADKPPKTIYKAPVTCPDVDFIVDYVRKIIVSCNDNMRMLTPRPTIRPRVKATDIDRLCYCRETDWPKGKFAEEFRKEAQANPCPLCSDAGKIQESAERGTTFDLANLRGPCGRAECRIARDLRQYIENLVEEDNKEFNLNDIIGPCGSKSCTLAEKIQEFIRHEGVFKEGVTLEGLSTQCACEQKMQHALESKSSCDTSCTRNCEESDSDASYCEGKSCPFKPAKVYNVYYFTVKHDFDQATPKTTSETSSRFKYCPTECPSVKFFNEKASCSKSSCSTFPQKDNKHCDSICTPICSSKNGTFPPSPADSDIVLQFSDIHNPCCVKSCYVTEKVKDFIVDGMQNQKNKSTIDDCYCDCVCTFKFNSKTTYCPVCGGYECLGEDMKDEPEYAKPLPCPVYHKLYDKSHIKTKKPWPEEEVINQAHSPSIKSSKTTASRGERKSDGRSSKNNRDLDHRSSNKNILKDSRKKQENEKKHVEKFSSNMEKKSPLSPRVEKKHENKYPYPQVPKHMGWNWTAEDIPALKFRPKWKPGAVSKSLVRKYRLNIEGMENIAKKKRALMQRKKKYEYKPMLIVKKKDGDYTVQMEVFKQFSKERLLGQYPYGEKAPLIYSIGKSEEEKMKIRKQKERRERRESRRKSRRLQSTFRDRCQEICLKAYNQAIGLQPLPNPNDPECPCYTQPPGNWTNPIVDSCSCSEDGTISTSDTDGDEWEIQFSPPAAKFDPKAKIPHVLAENESQYNYLDYKVKLLDKQGNQVVRYFKGPDGKQVCSDLGGFWNEKHIWLEINKDGYIGPDNRWVPMSFVGPDGLSYSAEDGQFTASSGDLLKIGIDGYIDKDGKWVFYPKNQRTKTKSAKSTYTYSSYDTNKNGKRGVESTAKGDVKGKTVTKSKAKMSKCPLIPPDKNSKVNKTTSKSETSPKNPLVMNVSMSYERNTRPSNGEGLRSDRKKQARYNEIMQDLYQFEGINKVDPAVKTNRASNTPAKKGLKDASGLTLSPTSGGRQAGARQAGTASTANFKGKTESSKGAGGLTSSPTSGARQAGAVSTTSFRGKTYGGKTEVGCKCE